MSNLYREYAEIYAEEKKLSERKEALKERVKAELEQTDGKMVANKFGSFKLSESPTWKYSEAVDKLKAKEVKNGIAQKVFVKKLNFTPNAMVS